MQKEAFGDPPAGPGSAAEATVVGLECVRGERRSWMSLLCRSLHRRRDWHPCDKRPTFNIKFPKALYPNTLLKATLPGKHLSRASPEAWDGALGVNLSFGVENTLMATRGPLGVFRLVIIPYDPSIKPRDIKGFMDLMTDCPLEPARQLKASSLFVLVNYRDGRPTLKYGRAGPAAWPRDRPASLGSAAEAFLDRTQMCAFRSRSSQRKVRKHVMDISLRHYYFNRSMSTGHYVGLLVEKKRPLHTHGPYSRLLVEAGQGRTHAQ
jgi:hypothetical protein